MANAPRSSGFTKRNRITLVRGGAPYFTLLKELIDKAREVIHIQVYILQEDSTGRTIADALVAAASRGVKVYLLADGYASQNLSESFIEGLKGGGVHFRFFEPLLRSTDFYFGRRLHQKTVVVDGRYATIGGINLADRYNDVEDIPAWLDYAVYMEGEAAIQLHTLSEKYWKQRKKGFTPQAINDFIHEMPTGQDASLRIRLNDWVKGKNEVWKTYFHLFNHATEDITIVCSYFLPGKVLKRQLSKASRRGVQVRVILTGPTDVPIAKHAERYLYDWMLRHNIRIFEYQPTVLHAKLAVADHRRVTIGSFNVNNISALASIEANAEIRSRRFALQVLQEVEQNILPHCHEITKEQFATRTTFFKKILQRVAYELIRIILNISTFYFKRE